MVIDPQAPTLLGWCDRVATDVSRR